MCVFEVLVDVWVVASPTPFASPLLPFLPPFPLPAYKPFLPYPQCAPQRQDLPEARAGCPQLCPPGVSEKVEGGGRVRDVREVGGQ